MTKHELLFTAGKLLAVVAVVAVMLTVAVSPAYACNKSIICDTVGYCSQIGGETACDVYCTPPYRQCDWGVCSQTDLCKCRLCVENEP